MRLGQSLERTPGRASSETSQPRQHARRARSALLQKASICSGIEFTHPTAGGQVPGSCTHHGAPGRGRASTNRRRVVQSVAPGSGERPVGALPEPSLWRVLVDGLEGVVEVVFADVAAEDDAGDA